MKGCRLRFGRFVTLLMIGLSPCLVAADDAKRVALVIGNSEYESAPLKNPSNDADALSLALKGLGFTVTTKKDVTKRQFEDAVDEVTDNLQSGDVCLIFYAGHGQGFENENYLIPVDAVLDRPQHVPERCVSVSYLMQALRFSECSLKIVVVDACRNNPFRSFSRSTPGLAESTRAPEGTIVSFSTSPKTPALDGNGENSPFVKHLAGAMRSRADEVEIVRLFREVSQAVKQETGQRPFLDFDASMPDYYLKRRRDLVPDVPKMKPDPTLTGLQTITNSVGMELKLIPAGQFLMGSPEDDADRLSYEIPQHTVRITQPFYLGVTEVTQGQWTAVMGTEPWNSQELNHEGADFPATYVSWEDAVEFCQRLTAREGVTYRLPTEAEWEYACRAQANTRFHFDNSANSLGDYAWFDRNAWDVDEKYAHAVKTKKPNRFGLHDMHGNVWEWCQDLYNAEIYKQRGELTLDPVVENSAGRSNRVLRGGGWHNSANECRSASRGGPPSTYRDTGVGFRVLRSSVK